MLHPRIQNLFRMLDILMPVGLLATLENMKDLQYVFEFKGEEVGTLHIYHGLPTGPKTDVERDWFKNNKVWFRRTAVRQLGPDRYEAYIEYMADYRDDVMVNLAKPICWLEFEKGKTAAVFTPSNPISKKALKIAATNLCPEIELPQLSLLQP